MLLMVYMLWQQMLTAAPFVTGSYLAIWNILRIRYRDKLIPYSASGDQIARYYSRIIISAAFGIALGIGFIVIGILTLLGG